MAAGRRAAFAHLAGEHRRPAVHGGGLHAAVEEPDRGVVGGQCALRRVQPHVAGEGPVAVVEFEPRGLGEIGLDRRATLLDLHVAQHDLAALVVELRRVPVQGGIAAAHAERRGRQRAGGEHRHGQQVKVRFRHGPSILV
ncbi:MAG: hypothetical protein U1F06_07325 [Steroidobacteraceae bacterium]